MKEMFEIGVNLRVTESVDRGERDHMEDVCECHFEREAGRVVLGFFGVFDGHGGGEAAMFARKALVEEMKAEALFWGEGETEVLAGVRRGFLRTQERMWAERDKWPRTINGYKSTAGTTATVAIVRNKTLYIGHVGDSACVLGSSKIGNSRTDFWEATSLTVEHKPTNEIERKRIESCGGSIIKKSGVERVVWKRPKQYQNGGHVLEGDSVQHDYIPFLAVTRSLGDLWSYDSCNGCYHISPDPDLKCISLDSMEHRCLILGSDGLWNVVSTMAAVEIVRICERETERRVFLDPNVNSTFFYNPAASLVKFAMTQWKRKNTRADNISAMVIMIDPPGPSMTKRRADRRIGNLVALDLENIVINQQTTSESFSKSLETELLIECSKWRSANDTKGENKIVNPKDILKSQHNDENDSILSLCENQKITGKMSHNNVTLLQVPQKSKAQTNLVVLKLENKCQKAITSHPFFSKFCKSWINNVKIWNFLLYYFQIKNLETEIDIITFLSELSPLVSSEILKIIPWIYCAKKRFRDTNQIHVSLNIVPLFSEFWIDLYKRFINPLEKRANNQYRLNMKTTIGILRPEIVSLLKQYKYLQTQYFADEEIRKYHLEDNNNKNNGQMLKFDKRRMLNKYKTTKCMENIYNRRKCNTSLDHCTEPRKSSNEKMLLRLVNKSNSFSIKNDEEKKNNKSQSFKAF